MRIIGEKHSSLLMNWFGRLSGNCLGNVWHMICSVCGKLT